ncbi:MAG: sensor histidine kinase [Desulfovibrio sp.]|nr:MAG: sensor histidine kinase [Desulfovibrio sp.]
MTQDDLRDNSEFETELNALRKRNAELEESVQRLKSSRDLTAVLFAISNAVATTRDIDELFAALHAILKKGINADNFFIALKDKANDRLVFPYFQDAHDDDYPIDNISDPAVDSLCLRVMRGGKPLFFMGRECLSQNLTVVGPLAEVWLGAPLITHNEVIGVMAVQDYKDPDAFTEQDVEFMTAVSEQASLAIERKMAEESMGEAREQALTAKDAMAAFMASVSHEIRTPLTSIIGFVKLLRKSMIQNIQPALVHDSYLTAKAGVMVSNLDIIAEEGDRLARLINDCLDLSRIESGKTSWHDVPMEPAKLAKRAVDCKQGFFMDKEDVHLVLDVKPDLPMVRVDPDKIQQVLVNLIDNGLKFTDKGSVTVSARCEDGLVEFRVADTGVGIPDDQLQRVFDKFHRASGTDTLRSAPMGTGLGLAICRNIVTHYGGTIWAESGPGKGATILFTLPAHPEADAAS